MEERLDHDAQRRDLLARLHRLEAALDGFLDKPRPATNADGMQYAWEFAHDVRQRLLRGIPVHSEGPSSVTLTDAAS